MKRFLLFAGLTLVLSAGVSAVPPDPVPKTKNQEVIISAASGAFLAYEFTLAQMDYIYLDVVTLDKPKDMSAVAPIKTMVREAEVKPPDISNETGCGVNINYSLCLLKLDKLYKCQ